MPLSKAAPRQHLHTREIRCRGFRRDDGLWDIEGTLEDTKSYSFDNRDRDGVAAGEAVHRMGIRLTIDDDMRVHAAEASTDAGPFDVCGDITPRFADLAGLVIGPGWRKAVLARMAGVAGCTHLTELLVGPVTTTAMQTVFAARARRLATADAAARPPIIDTCHALRGDGPIVAREWPAHSRPPAQAAAPTDEKA
ncbi:MAG: DUF2889 domain-containing protein [Rhodospirillales bacterium]|jgi:hypothetical protein|nr:DUF2889 domain-containing protein [Rhodospirillales bacterium]